MNIFSRDQETGRIVQRSYPGGPGKSGTLPGDQAKILPIFSVGSQGKLVKNGRFAFLLKEKRELSWKNFFSRPLPYSWQRCRSNLWREAVKKIFLPASGMTRETVIHAYTVFSLSKKDRSHNSRLMHFQMISPLFPLFCIWSSKSLFTRSIFQ